jgi:(methylthio)acryloyl-CoA hydratase
VASYVAPDGESMEHSRLWHATFDQIEYGRVPVVVALRGAVIGGGLELVLTGHVRVAAPSAFYSLPEGRLGIFVGGVGAVRSAACSDPIGCER